MILSQTPKTDDQKWLCSINFFKYRCPSPFGGFSQFLLVIILILLLLFDTSVTLFVDWFPNQKFCNNKLRKVALYRRIPSAQICILPKEIHTFTAAPSFERRAKWNEILLSQGCLLLPIPVATPTWKLWTSSVRVNGPSNVCNIHAFLRQFWLSRN